MEYTDRVFVEPLCMMRSHLPEQFQPHYITDDPTEVIKMTIRRYADGTHMVWTESATKEEKEEFYAWIESEADRAIDDYEHYM